MDAYESTAKNSSTIEVLGFDERGDLWVTRGSGEEFSTEPGQTINQLNDIPKKFRDLVVAVNHAYPDSEITDNCPVSRFLVATRRYHDSSDKLQTGFDVTFDVLRSDQTNVSTTYQVTDALSAVRLISVENIE